MFTIRPIDNNIFMIIKKDILDGEFLKKLPIEVYGFIRVDIFGKSCGMSFMNISQEVFDSNELLNLMDKAKKIAITQRKYY